MKSRRNKRKKEPRGIPVRSRGKRFAEVMQALDAVNHASSFTNPILEQLEQCPEAFKAGELVGKMFDTLKYEDHAEGGERLLPPAGLVMPLV